MIYLCLVSMLIMIVFYIVNKKYLRLESENTLEWNFLLFCMFFTPIFNIIFAIGVVITILYLFLYIKLFGLADADDCEEKESDIKWNHKSHTDEL